MSTPPINSCDSSAGLIQKYINTAYDNVKSVADNLNFLHDLYEFLVQYGLTTNIAVKAPVQIVATTPITLADNQTISWDAHSGSYTITAVTGNRVLVTGQTNPVENGIYNVQIGAWTRAVDFDGALDVVDGTLVFSAQGDAWQVDGPQYAIIPGEDPITFRDIDMFAFSAVQEATAKALEAAASAASAAESELNAQASLDAAVVAKDIAIASANTAEGARDSAMSASSSAAASEQASRTVLDQVQAVATSVGIVSSVAKGLANTTNGQYFTVGNGLSSETATTTYKNDNGTAVAIFSSVGIAAYNNLSDKILSIVLQDDIGNALAGFVDNNLMSPLFVDPQGYVIINNMNFYEKVQELFDKINAFYNFFSTVSSSDYNQKAGFIDDEGKLPLYFDEYGDIWMGEGPTNINQFVRDYSKLKDKVDSLEYEINGSGNIICDGDSLTAGAGSATARGYVERLRTRLAPQGITVTKRAVGGQGAQSIATRQGGYVNLLTVENNIVPAAIQPVNIVTSTQTPITNQGGGPIRGMLNGIEGTVAATFSGTTRLTYTFTRTVAGDSDTYIDPETPFIKAEDGHEYDIDIIWLGRNNTSSEDLTNICLDAIAACVKHLKAKNKRFVVMSILNGEYVNEYKDGNIYQRIINANKAIKAAYPENYLEVRGPLVRSYNPKLPQDVLDFSRDIVPASLRNDNIHLNDAGYDILEELVYNFIKSKGWVA